MTGFCAHGTENLFRIKVTLFPNILLRECQILKNEFARQTLRGIMMLMALIKFQVRNIFLKCSGGAFSC